MSSIDSINRQIILDNLNLRFENIKEMYIQATSGISDKEINSKFYLEISFFVEFILSNELTSQVFINLLNYESRIRKSEIYFSTLNKIGLIVKKVIKELRSREDLEDFTSISNEWKNPFFHIGAQPLVYKLDKFLKNIEDNFGKFNNFKIADETFSILSKILEDWGVKLKTKFDQKIIDQLNEYYSLIKELEYHEDFKSNFLNVKSANNLYLIFQSFNPKYISTDILDEMVKNPIRNGESHIASAELIHDCRKLLGHLRIELTTTHSLELIVARFRAFIELYATDQYNSEEACQREFERFLFLNGYYPISESRLGNGRFDSLAFNLENAFLYEYKYVKSVGDFKKQISSANVQASIYISRLVGLPRLSRNVFIIIFTEKKFEVMGPPSLVISGINFHLNIVSLDTRNPSKLKKIPFISIDEVVKG